jgi:RNA polymerase sigma-70 factor, ECF subfamily
LRTIQLLLGNVNPEHAFVYLHLSRWHLTRALIVIRVGIAIVEARKCVKQENGTCAIIEPSANMGDDKPDITALLRRAAAGEASAESDLLDAIYDQLRALARVALAGERPDHSFQPTVLVNEAFLRLRGRDIDFQNRQHYFAVAARAMRRILVDHARARLAKKRPTPADRVELDERIAFTDNEPTTIIAVDAALDQLGRHDERQARIVEMRFFGGLTEEEVGAVLKISPRTVKRDWKFARLWLFAHLNATAKPGKPRNPANRA